MTSSICADTEAHCFLSISHRAKRVQQPGVNMIGTDATPRKNWIQVVNTSRIQAALGAGVVHLGISVAVALVCATLVLGVWYPSPMDELAGGRGLFVLLIAVDVVCGPLLTLVVFDRTKPRTELWRDLCVVATLQVVALIYGLTTAYQARPVYMAFEGDRFRLVSVPDVDAAGLPQALPAFRSLPKLGPGKVGVQLAESSDADFLQSLELSINGLHPAFRPARWRPYEDMLPQVRAASRPLSVLRQKAPDQRGLIEQMQRKLQIPDAQLGYLPLVAGAYTDWVVLIQLDTGQTLAYLPIDGW